MTIDQLPSFLHVQMRRYLRLSRKLARRLGEQHGKHVGNHLLWGPMSSAVCLLKLQGVEAITGRVDRQAPEPGNFASIYVKGKRKGPPAEIGSHRQQSTCWQTARKWPDFGTGSQPQYSAAIASGQLLTGGLLVRVQPEEPIPRFVAADEQVERRTVGGTKSSAVEGAVR